MWVEFNHDVTGSDSPIVYYMNDDGELEAMETRYDPATKKVFFETDHFSYYVVGTAADADPDVPDAETGDSTMLVVGVVAAVIVVLAVALVVVRRRI